MLTIEMILKSGHTNTDRHEWNYQTVIKQNAQRVFIYDYPIDPIFKNDFEFHILSHFYKRNIIGVTGEFCYYLSERLNNLFPYYNEVLKRVGNYEELFGNGPNTETYTRTFNETGKGENTGKTSTVGKRQGSSTVNNVNRDFPTSIVTDISKYMTDSQEGDTNTQQNDNQDITDNGTNNYNRDTTETHNKTQDLKSDLNMYDYFIRYRQDIDAIYNYIYTLLDDLFYAVL